MTWYCKIHRALVGIGLKCLECEAGLGAARRKEDAEAGGEKK